MTYLNYFLLIFDLFDLLFDLFDLFLDLFSNLFYLFYDRRHAARPLNIAVKRLGRSHVSCRAAQMMIITITKRLGRSRGLC